MTGANNKNQQGNGAFLLVFEFVLLYLDALNFHNR